MRVGRRSAVRWLVVATFPAAAACSLFYPFDEIAIGEGPADASAGGDGNGGGDGPNVGDAIQPGKGCPNGRGPVMIRIDVQGGPSFCIDSTEVSIGQYSAFLEDQNKPDALAACSWNTDPKPVSGGPTLGSNRPQGKIDWCDAHDFCAWAGKRLCGALDGGGPWLLDGGTLPKNSEWMTACTKNNTRNYPYGLARDASACNDGKGEAGTTVDVGSILDCQGGYDGIFDMAGNVFEWDDTCNGPPGMDGTECWVRGGSYKSATSPCVSFSPEPVRGFGNDWGIRCCADVR